MVTQGAELADQTYFRIGGKAQYLARVESAGQLTGLLEVAWFNRLPVTVLGNASNVLIGDAGISGLVIVNRARSISLQGPGRIQAESGAMMGQLAQFAAEQGIAGFEFAVGIPGTVGGSVVGNAGCFGSDTATVLRDATIWRPDQLTVQTAGELGLGYRCSGLQIGPVPAVVVSATMEGYLCDRATIAGRMRQVAITRRSSQPARQSAGSIFKNPDGDFAGRLIDAAGLKGTRVGAAQVSTRHANFIINCGGARAAEVVELMELVRDRVKSRTGITLEPEIKLIGEGFGNRGGGRR